MARKDTRQSKAYKRISSERMRKWDKFLGCVGSCTKKGKGTLTLCELDCYHKHLRK